MAPFPIRFTLLALLSLAMALPHADALLNIDGSRNQVFVFGSVTLAYNSNIFSDATGRGDYTYNTNVGMDLKRRAGIIAVNATLKFDYQRYGTYTDQNALNPSFYVEFNKTTGRTTGAITVNAYRETRSDSAVNLNTTSWNYPLALNLKYPINDKLYVTSSTSFLSRQYTDATTLVNLTDYTESLDLFYVYTSKLDLLGGYRIRVSKTSGGNDTTDNWFNLGATGGLFSKLNGSIRIGYQTRNSIDTKQQFSNFNASAAINWPLSRKLTFGLQLVRDFNTIATGASVDSTTVLLQGTYTFNRQLEFNSGIGYGRNSFLGSNQPHRLDQFFNWDLGATYKFNEHLRLGATYTFFRNWSTFSYSTFIRQGYSINISSRY